MSCDKCEDFSDIACSDTNGNEMEEEYCLDCSNFESPNNPSFLIGVPNESLVIGNVIDECNSISDIIINDTCIDINT